MKALFLVMALQSENFLSLYRVSEVLVYKEQTWGIPFGMEIPSVAEA